MYNMMEWKNRLCLGLFCFLQRCVAWFTAMCNPSYCDGNSDRLLRAFYSVFFIRFNVGQSSITDFTYLCKKQDLPPSLSRYSLLFLLLASLFFQAETNAAVTYGARGNSVSGTTSLTVPYPTGIAAGDLLILTVGNKYPTNGPTTPTGWTLFQASGGLGTAGNDSGQVYSTVFVKEAVGTESGNLTVTVTSANTSMARMFRYTKAAGTVWGYAATTGSDNIAGPGRTWNVTGAANPGITVGDVVIVVSGLNGNRVTSWTESITATGATFGTVTERQDTPSGTGNDMGMIVSEHPVSSGTATAAPDYAMTAANGTITTNSPTGASVFLRIREIPLPTTTIATKAFSADTGTSSTDFITNTAAQTISGTLSAVTVSGEVVEVSLNNGTSWTTASNTIGTNTWSLATTLTASNTLQVRVTNSAGSGTAISQAYVLDTTAPTTTIATKTFSADTGISSTDFITNTAAQTISGTLSAVSVTGEIVEVSINNGSSWTTATNTIGTNTWSRATTLTASDTLKVRVTDTAGNSGTAISQAYVLDQTAPTLAITSNVSALKAGETATITFTFSEDPDATFTWNGTTGDVVVSNGSLGAISGSGTTRTATFTPTANLASGNAGITVAAGTYTDAAGNNGGAGTTPTISIDTSAPAAPVINAVATDNIINAAEQTGAITGTNETGATVALSLGGNSRAATVTGTTWSYTLIAADITAMGQGAETLSATQTDAAGNTSPAGTRAISVDTSVPVAPVINTVATDDIINVAEQTGVITGTNETGATVALSLGGNTRAATVTGTTWSYTLIAADITAMGQGAETLSATQTDAAGNTSPASTRAISVDTSAPTVSSVAISSATGIQNNTLNAGDVVSATVTMSEVTTVTGTPRLALNIGGTTVQANYASGSPGTTLVFTYTILAGQTDANGISIDLNSLTLNSGTIVDAVGNAATLTHTAVTDNAGYKVDTSAPAAPVINTVATDNIINTAEQTSAITGTNETGATVALSLGGNTRAATVTGTTWSYTLVAADITAMGQGAETLSATQTDAAGNTSAAGTRAISVDISAPAAPVINTVATDDIINAAEQTGAITGTNETGATVALSLGGNTRAATVTGTTWSYTLVAADITAMGQGAETLSATQTDVAGNTSAAGTRAISVDTSAPIVSSVAISSATGIQNSTLNAGDVVSVTVTMNEATTVTGMPQLALTIGSTPVSANYASGSGSTALVFTYTILAGQTDANGISIAANSLSGTLKDAAGNAATLTHGAVTDNAGYKVDTTAPTASVTTATIVNTGNAVVQSTETGTAYLVNNTVTVTNEASITSSGDTNFNSVSIATANNNTNLPATGLVDGIYKVYSVDAAGNLSAASTNSVTIGSSLNCISAGNGNWSAITWNNCRGGVPLAGDNVTIDHVVSLDITTPAISSLTINGSLTASASNTLTLAGNLTNNGTLSLGTSGNVILTAASQWTGTGATWTLNNLTLASQALSFNATDTFTLGINGSVSGLGTINSGAINTGITIGFTGTGAQTVPTTGVTYPNLTLSGGSTKTPASGTLDIRGNFNIATSTSFAGNTNNPSVTLKGNFSNSGAFAAGTGIWTFSGSSAQTLTGAANFNNLTVNNSSGLTLSNNVSVSTLLTLTNGAITTGTNIITTLANCSDTTPAGTPAGSVTRTNGFVDGNLRLTFPVAVGFGATTTCTFPVGSGTAYAPITVNANVTVAGTLTGSTTGYEHPQVVTSGIDTTLDANRYWTLWALGDTVSISGYTPTFNFITGDLDILATATNFSVGKYASSTWSVLSHLTATASSTSALLSSGTLTAITHFMVGETTQLCSVPAGSPADMTCVCDFFNRTNLNPSTISNGNWNLSSTGSTSFTPQIVSGRLQLTPNLTNVSTSATLPGTFPAAGNMIIVEFKHYAYAGTSGADGIALTLSDSSITPLAGAFGGSLGYAQKTGINGFAGGWIGIGIDEYGNFSSNTEGRTGGSAPGLILDSVAVRGSGSGQTGYPYLFGTGTLSPGIDDASSSTPAFGHAYRLTVDARNYTWNGSTGTKTAIVSLDRDTTGTGNSYSALFTPFNAYVANPSQANVPAYWKFSYTGSTGSSKNIHDIGSLKVCAQTFIPPAGYRIVIDNLSPTTCTSEASGQPTVTISALDNGGNVITNYTNTVTLSALLSGGGASSANWASQGTNQGSWDGSNKRYTFAGGDHGVAKFTLTDAIVENVYVAVSEYGGTLNSSSATPAQFSSAGFFTVANTDSLAANVAGGVVAGRPHKFTITRNTATCTGGADTAYTGAKSLDGWYSPVSGDHPSGAGAPRICTPNSGGNCLSSPPLVNCQVLSIAEPSISAGSNNMPALTFSNGVADFCLVTNDVGRYSVYLRDDSTGTAVTGPTSTLTARPFAIVVSDIVQGAVNNPASASSNAANPFVAGTNFSATVGGYLWNSSADTGADGLPGSVSKTTMISSGLASHYFDRITLAPISFVPNGAGTVQGTLSNGVLTVANGSATTTTLQYDEVGSFILQATPSSNYLNSGINLFERVSIFADNSSLSSWVGRFRPDHFAITAGTPIPGCGTFTYFGQDGFATPFTLTAQNANGGITQNYIGDGSSWAKLPLTVWGASPAFAGSPGFGFAVSAWSPSQPTGAVFDASGIAPTATNANNWVLGSATVTAKHQISRPSALTGETGVTLSARPVDSDGVTTPAAVALNAALLPLRYGRLALQNAYGSELLDLPMPLTAEYWNGSSSSWDLNAADSCTVLNIPTIGNGLALNLANAGLTAAATWNSPLASGNAGLSLSAPGATHTGYVDVTIDSPDWLYFNWDGLDQGGDGDLFDDKPTARATFGIYNTGNTNFIYIRELY